jgi:hypothetical protein
MIKTLILHFSSSVHALEMAGRKWSQKQVATKTKGGSFDPPFA